MNILLLGAPGVGKGTYADFLSEKYKIPHISSGDMFREAIKNKTEVGRKAEKYVINGLLVPDSVTIQFVKDRLIKKDCKNGFFLEGYPRTMPQAKAIEKFEKIDKVLNFVASMEIIIDRLSGRRTCKVCGSTFHIKNRPPKVSSICDNCGGELYQREDDKPETIKLRLGEYNKKTKPLIDYYTKKGLIANIDANPPFEEVHKVIFQCDRELLKIKKK
jgi:adenylate kinase